MVVIILGSKSDLVWGKEIIKNLEVFDIEYKMHISSAHKTPECLLSHIKKYDAIDKPLVYICVAGRSNALGGFVDANSHFPVINCPPQSDKFGGLDILSSLRMPTGVASMTILEPEQVAMAAAKILALENKMLEKKIIEYQKKIKEKIIRDNQEMNNRK